MHRLMSDSNVFLLYVIAMFQGKTSNVSDFYLASLVLDKNNKKNHKFICLLIIKNDPCEVYLQQSRNTLMSHYHFIIIVIIIKYSKLYMCLMHNMFYSTWNHCKLPLIETGCRSPRAFYYRCWEKIA